MNDVPLRPVDIIEFAGRWDDGSEDREPVEVFTLALLDVLRRPAMDSNGELGLCAQEVSRVAVSALLERHHSTTYIFNHSPFTPSLLSRGEGQDAGKLRAS